MPHRQRRHYEQCRDSYVNKVVNLDTLTSTDRKSLVCMAFGVGEMTIG